MFPGEGAHSDQLVQWVHKLDALGHRGHYRIEVFNDDGVQMPLPMVTQRARRSAQWLVEDVLHLSVSLPHQIRLRI